MAQRLMKDISCSKGITLNSQLVDLLSILDEDIPQEKQNAKINKYISTLRDRWQRYEEVKSTKNRFLMFKFRLNEITKDMNLSERSRKRLEEVYIGALPSFDVFDSEKMKKLLSKNVLDEGIHDTILQRLKDVDFEAKEGILELTPEKVRALYDHMFKDGNTYDRVTFDNAGKFSGYVSLDGKTYTPNRLDKMVDFCERHGMKSKINAFVFYADFPRDYEDFLSSKVSKGEISEEDKRDMMKQCLFDYVRNIGERYGDRIDTVDMFNELISDPDMKEPGFDEDSYGNKPKEYHLRKKGWFQYLTIDDLCELALEARKAMPNTTFTYNDMNWVNPAKRERIINIIKQIQLREQEYRWNGKLKPNEKGLIDNIGLEAHLWTSINFEQLERTVEDVETDIDLPIEVTELDICRDARCTESADELKRQNAIITKIMELANDGRISNITAWSQSDEMCFLNDRIGKNVHASVILDGDCNEKEVETDLEVDRRLGIEPEVQNFNYHTHTALCGHAEGKMENYVRKAIEAGMTTLGFSDHTPNMFGKDNPRSAMTFEQFEEEYIPTVEMLREKYKDQIDIKIGIESEYMGDMVEAHPRAQEFRKKLEEKLDYMILGQHYVFARNEDGSLSQPLRNSEKNSARYPIDYALTVVEGIRTGKFAYVAHPDIYLQKRYDVPKSEKKEFMENARVAAELICDAAKEYDIPLEVNLGSLAATKAGIKKVLPNNEMEYPVPEFWKVAEERGCKVLIGVDAHTPKALKNREDEIYVRNYLQSRGVKLQYMESFAPRGIGKEAQKQTPMVFRKRKSKEEIDFEDAPVVPQETGELR